MSFVFLQSNVDTSNATVYTFSGETLGDAAADRRIIVTASASGDTAGAVSTITVGGQSATIKATVVQTGGGTAAVAIATADVPSGTTGDVVVTWSQPKERCSIALYRGVAMNPGARDSDTDDGSVDNEDISLSLDCAQNGYIVAAARQTGTPTTADWSGVTELHQDVVETSRMWTGGLLFYASGASGQAVTCDFDAGTNVVGAAASFSDIATESVAGTTTPTGALKRGTGKPLAGSITPTGALASAKTMFRSLAGSMAATGVLTAAKTMFRSLAGSMTATGGVTFIGSPIAYIVEQITKFFASKEIPSSFVVDELPKSFVARNRRSQ